MSERQENRVYIAIDLKSFYASVECIERGLNPLTTNLVVADESKTEKTICLAVSPPLKSYGISGRPRLFEVIQKIREINHKRGNMIAGQRFVGVSCSEMELQDNPYLAIGYITAAPRMALYIKYSARVYEVYLKYVAPEDIHVYSIDEVFMDVTGYLNTYQLTPRELAIRIIRDVLQTTGITATAGIGTNLYLCKVAMDIVAKQLPADEDGVRIAELDEMSYRKRLWTHEPLTDFWRIGNGYAHRLNEYGIYTMGDIARCSIGDKNDFYNEDLLYRLFGVNAELLIDHAWGWEPCTMEQIKRYRPESNSLSSGQVLWCPYEYAKGRIIVKEMLDLLVLDLVDRGLVTDQIVLTVGYDIENLMDSKRRDAYNGKISLDMYGRSMPKPAHGTVNLGRHTSSTQLILKAVMDLYNRIVNKDLLIRRVNITANHIVSEDSIEIQTGYEQLDLFRDYEAIERQHREKALELDREKRIQQMILAIQKKYGKNAVLRGMNLQEGAMTTKRNKQIGGHNA